MVTRRHLLSLLTLAALLVVPFAGEPRPAQAATVTYRVDKLDDSTTAGTTCDDGTPNDCSLRDAITKANAAPDADTKIISFILFTSGALSGSAPFVIMLNSLLPPISDDNVQITAAVRFGIPQVEIDGNGRAVGFQISGDNGLVKGLSMYGFTNFGLEPFFGSAIYITGAGNRIETNFIGLSSGGRVVNDKENFSGIRIDGSAATGNIIGGVGGEAVANYISGNLQNGVIIRDASGNFVQNNIIGLARQNISFVARGNGQYGIQITSLTGTSANNVIGGADLELANVIGANGQAGVLIRGSNTSTTTLQSNYIGLDSLTQAQYANLGEAGVIVEAGARSTRLSGPSGAQLVISGNAGYGVVIREGEDSTFPVGTRIDGFTFIGTSRGGTGALANDMGGVLIAGASDTTIDGSAGSVRISGNNGPGVTVGRSQGGRVSTGTSIIGALVGVTPNGTGEPSGTNQTPNNDGGILVDRAELTTLRGNTISGNGLFGLRLSNALSSTVQGNFVGLNIARDAARSNSGPGIIVSNSRSSLIGGDEASLGNFLAGNIGAGVVISGTNTISTTVDANRIGLACSAGLSCNSNPALFTASAANQGEGVLVQNGAKRTTIGGTLGNVIGSDANSAETPFDGVRIADTGTTTVTVSLNSIGFALNSNQQPVLRPNANGISITQARSVEVLSNTVRFNTADAVRVTAAFSVTIHDNLAFSRNGGSGVNVDGGSFGVAVLSNTIRANTGPAVRAEGAETRRVRIVDNRMAANGGAIELVGTSIYSGTLPDTPAPGPNHDIDPPFGVRVARSGLISGFVYTRTNTLDPIASEADILPISACISCTIAVYRPDPTLDEPDGQGWERLALEGGDTIVPDAQGLFSAQLVGAVPNQLLLAATDGFGNTSEFFVFDVVVGLRIVPVSPNPPARNAAPGDVVTYRLRLENTGTLDLGDVEVTTSGTLPRWELTRVPSGTLAVPAGSSRLISVTLELPTGADPSVRVPIADNTLVTAASPGLISDTERLITTVIAQPVLRVSPVRGSGSGLPNDRVTYLHRLSNDGNISVTVALAASTLDPANSGRIWATSLNTSTLTLGPGESRDISVSVTVPGTAQQGVGATTYLSATVAAFPNQTRYFSDTTTVALKRLAQLYSDEVQNGAAGREVTFLHTVENTSNGRATFKLNYSTNYNSQVRFESDTPGVTIDPDNNTFTLDNTSGQELPRLMVFKAIVTLDRRLLAGDQEVVTIFLSDPISNQSIGGATVVDRVNITIGLVEPRLWLPMIYRQ